MTAKNETMKSLIEILKPGTNKRDEYVPVLLAPMAGITDSSFRVICVEMGCDFTFTEMVSAKGIHYNNAKTRELLYTAEEERPCGVQLFGHESNILAETAKKLYAEANGEVSVIDINMGCPAPKITGNGDGSALMRNPKLAGEIIHAVSHAVPIPVSVKFRTGWDDSSVNAVEFARIAEQNGAAFVTVHGRTRAQMYSGSADRDVIAAVVDSVSIPVVGNGDIFDGESARHMINHTHCAGIMVARGAQGNPFIFSEIRSCLNGEEYAQPTDSERLSIAERHIEDYIEHKTPGAFVDMRKHIAWYTKGMTGSNELRRQVNSCPDANALIKLLTDFKMQVK